jgi:hypothetical protein
LPIRQRAKRNHVEEKTVPNVGVGQVEAATRAARA